MAAIYSDNINYVGNKPNFERDRVKTLAQLLAEEPAKRRYPFGHIVFCEEDNNHYKFNYDYENPGSTQRNDVTGWFEKVVALSLSQTTGDNTGAVMSQAAITAELEKKVEAEDTALEVDSIEETLVTNALRKTAQILTDAEKQQVQKNIGVDGLSNAITLERERAMTAEGKLNNSLLAQGTVRFDRIVEEEITINTGTPTSTPEIVYSKHYNKFVVYDGNSYWDTWDGMEAYMSGSKIREDKVYLCGDELYIWMNESLQSATGRTYVDKLEAVESHNSSSLFNGDNKNYEYLKTIKILPQNSYLIIPYLGKTECTFLINGESNDFIVQGRNVATGNLITLRNCTKGDIMPVEFANPRPDLELSEIIVYAKAYAIEGQLDITINKNSPIIELNNKIIEVANALTAQEKEHRVSIELKGELSIGTSQPLNNSGSIADIGEVLEINRTDNSSWVTGVFNVKEGDLYYITGKGGSLARLFFCTDTNGILNEMASAEKSVTDYKISIKTKGFLYVNFDVTQNYSIKKYELTYSVLLPKIEQEAEASNLRDSVISNFIFDARRNIFCIQKQFEYKPTLSSKHLFDIKKGENYILKIATTTYGFKITLNGILPNGKTQALRQYDATESVYEYSWTPSKNYIGVAIYFAGSAYDGVCTFDVQQSDAIVTDLALFKKRGVHQFGKTCNCKYNAPNLPALSIPKVGERLNYFYSLYDELMVAYPTYISKVDCDEVATASGIAKPNQMEGYPIYMYKFSPAPVPNNPDTAETSEEKLKVFITSGTHPEYTSIFDLYQTMRLISQEWTNDDNLEELRWNCEFYIMPCSSSYCVEHGTRVNYNGVDLNRNAPTENWALTEDNGYTYSGPEAGSEYESKVFVQMFADISPTIYIDHHNTNIGDGKNMMYITNKSKWGVDIGCAHVSQMTRMWKLKHTSIFPNLEDDPITMFGYSEFTKITGSRNVYGDDQGVLSFTYESNDVIVYSNGVHDTEENVQRNTELVITCATEGFINFLLRVMKNVGEIIK